MVLKNLFKGNNGETDIESRLMDLGREGVRCMERITWKLTLPYVKIDSQQEFALCLRKLKQRL